MNPAHDHQLRITAAAAFDPKQSSPDEDTYLWNFAISIQNNGEDRVTVRRRRWQIVDGDGSVYNVTGDGIKGQQPEIAPGTTLSFQSECPLMAPHGMMSGTYLVEAADGRTFEVEIPAFSLDSPFAKRTLN